MKWFIENWSLLVVIAAVIFLGAVYANRFMRLPSDGKINLVKQWALFIVTIFNFYFCTESFKTFNMEIDSSLTNCTTSRKRNNSFFTSGNKGSKNCK